MHHVQLVTLPQSFASGVLGAMELIMADANLLGAIDGRPRDPNAAYRVELVGPQAEVVTAFGPRLSMDCRFADAPVADVVYVSPLALAPTPKPDFGAELREWLRAQYAAGALVCGACTGTLPIAASGLLDGFPATTHWGYEGAFRRHYPDVDLRPRRTLVAAGVGERLVTAGAHASWYDLTLYLIHRFSGAAAARRVAAVYLLDWHELDHNAYACFCDNRHHEDAAIQNAQRWLREHLSNPQPVEAAIAASGLSPRSFRRRFRQATGHTPIGYVHRLRVERAKELLESCDDGVEEIAWRVGYEDVAYLRRLFRRLTGLSPAHYRKALRSPPAVQRAS